MSEQFFTPRHILANNFEVMKKLDSLEYGSDTQIQCSLDPEFMSLDILDGGKSFEINGVYDIRKLFSGLI